MIDFSSDPSVNKIANEQQEYFVSKYRNNINEQILRAKTEKIIKDALKNWKPSQGNLKTHLNGQLKQLSREFYKNQIVYVPENQQLLLYKARKVIDEHKDTYGGIPTAEQLAKDLNITTKKSHQIIKLYGGVSKGQFDTDTQGVTQESFDTNEIINSIPNPLHRDVARDLYVNELPTQKIFKKYGFKQTKLYEIKKDVDHHIGLYAERINHQRGES